MSVPFNVVIRGTTDARGQVVVDFEPPPDMVGRCLVRLASFYIPGDIDSEIRLLFGGSGYSYDTGVTTGEIPVSRGVSQTLLANTSTPTAAPRVFRDVPIGPQRLIVEVVRNDTGAARTGNAVVLQLQIERI